MSLTQTAIDVYKRAYRRYHGTDPRIISTDHGWIRLANVYNSQRPSDVIKMAQRLDRMANEQGIDRTHEINNRPPELMNAIETIRNILPEEAKDHDKDYFINLIRNRMNNNDIWDVRDELKEKVRNEINNKTEEILDNNSSPTSIPAFGWQKSIKKDLIIAFFNQLFEQCGNSAFDMERAMSRYAYTGELFNGQDCSDCEFREENEYLEDKIEAMEANISNYQNRIRNLNRSKEVKEREIYTLEKELVEMRKKLEEVKKNSILFTMDDEVGF